MQKWFGNIFTKLFDRILRTFANLALAPDRSVVVRYKVLLCVFARRSVPVRFTPLLKFFMGNLQFLDSSEVKNGSLSDHVSMQMCIYTLLTIFFKKKKKSKFHYFACIT